MQGLIDTLFGNPLLLFFIIAALFSFFRRAGGGNQEQGKGQNTNPPQNRRTTTEQDKVDWREIFTQEQTHREDGGDGPHNDPARSYNDDRNQSPIPADESRATTAEKERNQANRDLYDKYEKAKQRKEVFKNPEEIGASPISDEIRDKIKPKVSLNFNNISRDEVIKGIVWSEILNKPKSRRQHR